MSNSSFRLILWEFFIVVVTSIFCTFLSRKHLSFCLTRNPPSLESRHERRPADDGFKHYQKHVKYSFFQSTLGECDQPKALNRTSTVITSQARLNIMRREERGKKKKKNIGQGFNPLYKIMLDIYNTKT